MADWPDSEEVKQVLDVVADDWDTTIDRVRAAAIDKVKRDVGKWDELVDEPDDALAQAALRLAELISERPGGVPSSARAWAGLASDPTYATLLSGHRRSFGIG
jgi:hypothetical protein